MSNMQNRPSSSQSVEDAMPQPVITVAGERFDAPGASLAQPNRQINDLSSKLHRYETILEKLFPNIEPEALVDLSADALLELSIGNRVALGSEPSSSELEDLPSPKSSRLDILEYIPEDGMDQNQLEEPQITVEISDDVNALSALTKNPSTYQGISSTYAALKAILRIDAKALGRPEQFSILAQQTKTGGRLTEAPCWANTLELCSPVPSPKALEISGPELIDAYFANFHPFAPLIDEASFRRTYFSCRRTDARWMGLLNTVFALGSIAASGPKDLSHFTYYRRAMSHVNLSSLGATGIEIIQTLALMGGFYLHYINQPNLAHIVMGASLRMAASLGLYKDLAVSQETSSTCPHFELNRRVWWSIFCLDTWACMPLGRPPFGRMGKAVTVQLPRGALGKETPDTVLPFVDNIGFCKVATKIQESLAISPLIPHSELKALDRLLLQWYAGIHPIFKGSEASNYAVAITRPVMRWRFQIQRMLLHRPVLLNYALSNTPYEELNSADRNAIEICRGMADELIRDISSCSFMNSVVCANGAWYIFQAAMTPLLGLFTVRSTADNSVSSREFWRLQVEMTLSTLLRMQQWSLSALRSWDLLNQFLGASQCHFSERNERDHESVSAMEDEMSIHTEAAVPSTGYDQTASGNCATREFFWDFVSNTEINVPLELDDFDFDNAVPSLSGFEDQICAFDFGGAYLNDII